MAMELGEIEALIAAVEHGTIFAAAKQIGVPRTTLSRRLASLEAKIGVPLLMRTGSEMLPTPTGRLLIDGGRPLLDDAARLYADVLRSATAESGRITVLMSVGVHPIATAMITLTTQAQLADLKFHVKVVEDPLTHLATEGDFALVLSPRPLDGPWLVRRALTAPFRLLATPTYLKEAGTPTSLEELQEHSLFVWSPAAGEGALPLLSGGSFPVTATLSTTCPLIGWEAARAGAGIALAPNARLPNDGWPAEDVVEVLPDQVGCDVPVWLVAPASLSRRPGLSVIIDTIITFMATAI